MSKNYNKEIVKLVKENGCTFIRHGKGDHDIWFSPITNRNFTVDGNIKSKQLANAVMKQSGVKYRF
ncbi:MAG: type II toxin-antitoxin system HicA family toxin [Lachnospiraceae bacterium]|nr:type II toxin-antitoxin system HicA family toxin [Lachnospiraceae bacterium]